MSSVNLTPSLVPVRVRAILAPLAVAIALGSPSSVARAGILPPGVDSDSDGLPDVVETGTGRYVSLENTGTDPLDSDSDGDGLLDGYEVVDSRRLRAWGSLGLPPSDLAGTSNIVRVSASAPSYPGGDYAIAQSKNGNLLSWGTKPVSPQNPSLSPLRIDGFVGAISFDAGGETSLAVDSNGLIRRWSSWGDYTGISIPAQQIFPPLKMVSSGYYRSAAVTQSGTVYEWGLNYDGSGKSGFPFMTDYPKSLPRPVRQVSCGWSHTLALLDDCTVVSWGESSFVPSNLSDVVEVNAGGFGFSMALRSNGSVVAWTSQGELPVPADFNDVVQLDVWGNSAVARKSDGSLAFWGPKPAVESRPQDLRNVVDVSHGGNFMIALEGLNPLGGDSDGDGLGDGEEVNTLGTNPLRVDSDGDGLGDGDEVHVHTTDPLKIDTDGDGMLDGWELNYGFNPLDPVDGGGDEEPDGLLNAGEFSNGTNPNVSDSDGDGLSDGMEVNTLGTSPMRVDTDGDGLGDGDEVHVHRTDPLKMDTDGDGMPDGWELDYGLNPLDDVDGGGDDEKPVGDGLLNAEEFSNGTNPHFFDYFLYSVLQDGSLRLTSYRFPGDTSLHVPDTIDGKAVSQIAPGAFRDLVNLESVTIADGITSIGDYAFAWLANLSTVTLSSTSTLTSIGVEAFRNTAISSLPIPGGVTSIGSYAFAGCFNLTIINWPQGATTIPEGVFSGSGLTQFTIPSTVTSIGSSAFANCSGLTSLSIPDGVTSIGSYAFGGAGLTSIVFPGSIEYFGDSNNSSGGGWGSAQAVYGLSDCASLTSITISEGTKGIYSGAFANLTYLNNIVIAGTVTSIGDGAFFRAGRHSSNQACSLEVRPPSGSDNWLSVGSSAFEYSGVTEATFARDSINFGSNAFSWSSRLAEFQVPTTAGLSFGNSAFAWCSELASIGSPATIYWVGDRAFEYSGLSSVQIAGGYNTQIGAYAFANCSGLTGAILRDVTSIGEYAFSGASSLANVAISSSPNSYTAPSIAAYAFANCSALTNVIFPETGVIVGPFAFSSCTGLMNIHFPERAPHLAGWQPWPGYISPYISTQAFDGCTNLASVTIGSSIYSVFWSAFSNCPNLATVTLSMDYNDGFNSQASLTDVTVLRGAINNGSFYGCSNLSNVTLAEGVTSIGSQAFGNCPKLTQITIPESVTSIWDNPFLGSTNLATINVDVAAGNPSYFAEGGVLYSGSRTSPGAIVAYPPAKAGGSLSLPPGLSTVSSGAFDSARYLESVTFPSSVTTIGYRAFAASSVIEFYFEGDAPSTLSGSPFENMLPEAKVYCYATSNGFESSPWNGLPVVVMNPGTTSVRSWLQNVGLHPSTSLTSDPGQRGVSLLKAYAFNMDPLSRNTSLLPRPEVSGSTMSMRFYASSSGVNYQVETSEDLKSWSTNNVTVLHVDGYSTATTPMNGGRRFMRIKLTGPQ